MKTLLLICLVILASCKTRSELRREQEMQEIKSKVQNATEDRADLESLMESWKTEKARMMTEMDEQAQLYRRDTDELKNEVNTLKTRIEALEQRAVAQEVTERKADEDRKRATFENGKRLYDEGKLEDAIDVLKIVARNRESEDGKKAQYLLAEAFQANRDYASAALEFNEYKKLYPKDPLWVNATFKQAQAFKSLGKSKEAKLFFSEIVEKHPKHSLASKAKNEMKRLK